MSILSFLIRHNLSGHIMSHCCRLFAYFISITNRCLQFRCIRMQRLPKPMLLISSKNKFIAGELLKDNILSIVCKKFRVPKLNQAGSEQSLEFKSKHLGKNDERGSKVYQPTSNKVNALNVKAKTDVQIFYFTLLS